MKLIRGGALLSVCWVLQAQHKRVSRPPGRPSATTTSAASRKSAEDPALQASLDYAHDSGWYVGAWASNIDFGVRRAIPRSCRSWTSTRGFTKTLDSPASATTSAACSTPIRPSGLQLLRALRGCAAVHGEVRYSPIKGKFFYSPDFGGDTTAGRYVGRVPLGDLTMPVAARLLDHRACRLQLRRLLGRTSFGDDASTSTTRSAWATRPASSTSALKYIDGSDLNEADGTPTTCSAAKHAWSSRSRRPSPGASRSKNESLQIHFDVRVGPPWRTAGPLRFARPQQHAMYATVDVLRAQT